MPLCGPVTILRSVWMCPKTLPTCKSALPDATAWRDNVCTNVQGTEGIGIRCCWANWKQAAQLNNGGVLKNIPVSSMGQP